MMQTSMQESRNQSPRDGWSERLMFDFNIKPMSRVTIGLPEMGELKLN
jgi:hypothetical protein